MKKLLLISVLSLCPLASYAIPVDYMQIPVNPLQTSSSGMVVYTGVTTYQGSASAMLPKTVNYYINGKLNEALKEINEIMLYCPNDAQAQFLRSQINFALGDIESAIDAVNKTINLTENNKLYIWRMYLLIHSNDSNKLPQIFEDMKKVLATDDKYRKRVFDGYYNKYIWDILNNKNISSHIKSEVFKNLLILINKDFRNKYNNIHIVPVLASYIQYVFGLDNSDELFTELGKNKSQFLKDFTSIQQGQYASIISGIFTYASGDIENGSTQILNGFKKIDVDRQNINHAVSILYSSRNLLKPSTEEICFYGIGVGLKNSGSSIKIESLAENSPAKNLGVRVGDVIVSINGQQLNDYPRINQVQAMLLQTEKNTAVKITFYRQGPILGKEYTVSIPRIYPIKFEKYNYYKIPDAQLKNGQTLGNYLNIDYLNKGF